MAVVEISSGSVLEGQLPQKALAMVREWTELHKTDLLHMWESQDFEPIPPLE